MKASRKRLPRQVSSRGVMVYPQVRDSILRQLEAHKYTPGTRLPTDVEYASELRVDRLTVSRALNELAREGRVVRRRGAGTFVADALHPPLIMSRHLRIAVLFNKEVLPDTVASSFEGQILRGLLELWGLQCATVSYFQGTLSDPTRATWTLRERGVTVEALGRSIESGQSHPPLQPIRDGKYDAIISLGIITDAWLESLLSLGTPVILVDYPGDRFCDRADTVYVDPLGGYRKAVAWLATQSYRRIHFLGYKVSVSPPSSNLTEDQAREFRTAHKQHDPDSLLRTHAFRVAMEEAGLPIAEKAMHVLSNKKTQFADMSAQLLALPEEERPEVLVCAALEQARDITQAFRERNLPLLAIGAHFVDSVPGAMMIKVDCAALGEAAATLALSRLTRPERPHLRVGINMTFNPGSHAPAAVAVPALASQ
jgi:DNA-binding LacI/PurR family transcriptional regulator/DNA-binding transcriptional regulator YhcF (GntR family)